MFGSYRQHHRIPDTKARTGHFQESLAPELNGGVTVFDHLHSALQEITLPEEVCSEESSRFVVELCGFTDFHDPPFTHYDNPICDRHRFVLIMRHMYRCES